MNRMGLAIGAVVVVGGLGAGGYFYVVNSIKEQVEAGAQALEQQLPPGSSITYGAVSVDPFAKTAVFSDVTADIPDYVEALTIDSITVEGVSADLSDPITIVTKNGSARNIPTAGVTNNEITWDDYSIYGLELDRYKGFDSAPLGTLYARLQVLNEAIATNQPMGQIEDWVITDAEANAISEAIRRLTFASQTMTNFKSTAIVDPTFAGEVPSAGPVLMTVTYGKTEIPGMSDGKIPEMRAENITQTMEAPATEVSEAVAFTATVDSMRFRDMDFGAVANAIPAFQASIIDAAKTNREPDVSEILDLMDPIARVMGSMEVQGYRWDVQDLTFGMEQISFAMGGADASDNVFNHIRFQMDDLTIPGELFALADDEVPPEIPPEVYANGMKLSFAWAHDFDPASGTLTLGPTKAEVDKLINISAGMTLGDVPPLQGDPETYGPALLQSANFQSVNLFIEDEGFVREVLPKVLNKDGMSIDLVTAMISTQGPAMLGQFVGPDLAAQLSDHAVKFLRDPTSLAVTITAKKPVPLQEAMMKATLAPQMLVRDVIIETAYDGQPPETLTPPSTSGSAGRPNRN
ncbi:MAG: hypothetical protein ACPGOY_16860 [Rhodospirillaceae bacterium]